MAGWRAASKWDCVYEAVGSVQRSRLSLGRVLAAVSAELDWRMQARLGEATQRVDGHSLLSCGCVIPVACLNHSD